MLAEVGVFDTLISAAGQVPNLVVMAIIVYIFLLHITKANTENALQQAAFHKALEKREETLCEIGESCHLAHKELIESNKEYNRQLNEECRNVIKENSQVIKDNTIALSGIRFELNKRGNPGS